MITLPTERSKPESYNPQLLIILGRPKSGKSSFIASIPDNLVIDLEDGYRALSVMKVQARTAKDLFEIREAIIAKGKEIKKRPYRFITIDNATRLEELAVALAGSKYQHTAMGQNWGWLKDANNNIKKDAKGNKIPDPKADVRLLPNGAGFLYLRLAIRQLIDMFKPLCETLILVTHTKDKQIRVDGSDISEVSVDLAGKTSDIICGEADAVGLIYRKDNKTILTFKGGDNTIKEARSPHLRGKEFVVGVSDKEDNVKFNSSKIFLPEVTEQG